MSILENDAAKWEIMSKRKWRFYGETWFTMARPEGGRKIPRASPSVHRKYTWRCFSTNEKETLQNMRRFNKRPVYMYAAGGARWITRAVVNFTCFARNGREIRRNTCDRGQRSLVSRLARATTAWHNASNTLPQRSRALITTRRDNILCTIDKCLWHKADGLRVCRRGLWHREEKC